MMVTKDEIITMTGGIVKLLEASTYAPLKELENLEGVLIRACSHQRIKNQDGKNKTGKNNIQLVVTSENTPETLQPPKESLNLISSLIKLFVVFPLFFEIAFWWNDRLITKLPCR